MTKLFLLFLLLLNLSLCIAQIDTLPLVTVTGEYAIKVKPDYVILGISVNKSLSLNSSELKIGFRIFEKEDTYIRLFDFDNKDITESLIRVEKLDNRPVYIKDIFITIKNTNKLNEILLELHKSGFTNYKYIDYRVLNLGELKDRARVEALKLAKEKAVLLAATLEQTIGKAHSIEDIEAANYNWYTTLDKNRTVDYGASANSNDYLVDPGYIVILSKVKVRFNLTK